MFASIQLQDTWKQEKSDLDRFDFYNKEKYIIYLDVQDLPYSFWPKGTLFTVSKAQGCISFLQSCRNTAQTYLQFLPFLAFHS